MSHLMKLNFRKSLSKALLILLMIINENRDTEVFGPAKISISVTLKGRRNSGEEEDDEKTFSAIGKTKRSAKITVAKKAIQELQL